MRRSASSPCTVPVLVRVATTCSTVWYEYWIYSKKSKRINADRDIRKMVGLPDISENWCVCVQYVLYVKLYIRKVAYVLKM